MKTVKANLGVIALVALAMYSVFPAKMETRKNQQHL